MNTIESAPASTPSAEQETVPTRILWVRGRGFVSYSPSDVREVVGKN